MKVIGKLFLAFVLLLLFLIFSIPAKAVRPLLCRETVNSLKVDIKVSAEGEVGVEKKFLFPCPTERFSWVEDASLSRLEIFTNGSELGKKDYRLKKNEGKLFIEATIPEEKATEEWLLRYKATKNLQPSLNALFDDLSLILVLEPGLYIEELSVFLNLPRPVSPGMISPRTIAVHGVEMSEEQILDSKTVLYSGQGISPSATFTIKASWPDGLIEYPFSRQIFFFIRSRSFEFWLVTGLVLPFLTILWFFYLLYLKRREEKIAPSAYLDKPPDELAPALVGLLLREEVSQREITATILDLARRGFLDIVKKRDEYILGKRTGQGELQPFEAYLYEKIFTEKGERKIKRTEFEIEKQAKEQFYSPKISQFHQALYQEIQERNYFLTNPGRIVLKYRTLGILFFLLGVATAVSAAIFSSNTPFALFGSVGEILSGFLVIKIAPYLSKRTNEGRKAIVHWLSFGQFLTDRNPLKLLPNQQNLFEQYLPYAVALGKEIDWARRFSRTAFTPPSWYLDFKASTLESFAAGLFYVAGSLSQTLYRLKEPGV